MPISIRLKVSEKNMAYVEVRGCAGRQNEFSESAFSDNVSLENNVKITFTKYFWCHQSHNKPNVMLVVKGRKGNRGHY